MANASEKPVLFADERSDVERFDPSLHRGYLDPSRVPGYAEIVQANDIARADPLRFRDANKMTQEDVYRKLGAQPQKLPVEYAWLPVSGAGGAPSQAQTRIMDRYTNQEGFRIARWPEDFEPYGFTEFPPLGRLAEDQSIRRGADTALFVRSGEVARKWEAFKIMEQAEAEGRKVNAGNAPGAFYEKQASETITVKH